MKKECKEEEEGVKTRTGMSYSFFFVFVVWVSSRFGSREQDSFSTRTQEKGEELRRIAGKFAILSANAFITRALLRLCRFLCEVSLTPRKRNSSNFLIHSVLVEGIPCIASRSLLFDVLLASLIH